MFFYHLIELEGNDCTLASVSVWSLDGQGTHPRQKGHKTGSNNLFNQLKLLSLWLLMGMMT